MSTSGERLARARRLDSEMKVSRVLAVVAAMAEAGEGPRPAVVARRAKVSRRFIYDHKEPLAEIALRQREICDRFTTGVVTGARTTAASVRADLEHTKAHNRRLQDEIVRLERRLGELLGQEVRAEMAGREVLIDNVGFDARVETLEAELLGAREELRRREEELHAARQINRDLIARLNRE